MWWATTPEKNLSRPVWLGCHGYHKSLDGFLVFMATFVFVSFTESDIHGYGKLGNAKAEAEVMKYPIILWWTGFTGEKGAIKQCGDVRCFVTVDRHYRNHPQTKAGISVKAATHVFMFNR